MKRLQPLNILGGLLLPILLGGATPISTPVPDCIVPPDVFAEIPSTVSTRVLIAKRAPVSIIVIGGMSTLGAAAGGLEFAWPNRLAEALAARHPGTTINVFNKAQPNNTAEMMLSRFEKEILPANPALVIWETGTRDAVNGVDLDAFRETLQQGIDQLHERNIEVVLMDSQFSSRTQMIVNFSRYADTMRDVASANNIGVFPRHDIMRIWAEEGVFDFEVNERNAVLGLARRLYDCIGQAVATFIDRDPELRTKP
jgi:acyl-CoA thioesterase I